MAGARRALAAWGFAALVVEAPAVQAGGFGFGYADGPVQIGNFLISADYTDGGADFQINYVGPNNPLLYGNLVDLKDVHFGGGADLHSPVMGWIRDLRRRWSDRL